MFIPLGDKNTAHRMPTVVLCLVALNFLTFAGFLAAFAEIPGATFAYVRLSFVPAIFERGLFPETLITSMFLHAGWWHLFGNMAFLLTFGKNVEDALGHRPFLLFYICCGICGGLVHYQTDPMSILPLVGASSAISGVVGAYVVGFPRQKITFVIPPLVFMAFQLRAVTLVAVWVLFQLFMGWRDTGAEGGSVAYWAHLGGFLAGMLLYIPLRLFGYARPLQERRAVRRRAEAEAARDKVRQLRKSRQG